MLDQAATQPAEDLRVREAALQDQPAWDRFVERSPCAHLAHRFAWSNVIQKAFGHRPIYLLVENGTKDVVGLLPLFHVRGMLFGEALISVPYLNGGGILARDDKAAALLLRAAEDLAQELGVLYTELRHREEAPGCAERAEVRSHKAAMLLALNSNAEELFNSFPAKLRSQIRRPTKDGLIVALSQKTPDDHAVNQFYKVFCENMRDLGTPVYPRCFFLEAVRAFPGSVRIATVMKGREPLAAGITIGTNGVCEIPWASSLKRFNKLSPNMLLYWGLIKAACEDGWGVFDFGRSSLNSGTYRFKQQWGAKPLLLHWYYPKSSRKIPDINPKSAKFRLLVACWQKMPLSLANILGPWLTRSLP